MIHIRKFHKPRPLDLLIRKGSLKFLIRSLQGPYMSLEALIFDPF